MNASTSSEASSSRIPITKKHQAGLRKRTHGLREASQRVSDHGLSTREDSGEPIFVTEPDEMEEPSLISDSSQEYGFERDETVDTSIDEDEGDDVKTPTRSCATPEAGVGDTLNTLLGTSGKATKRNAKSANGGYEPPSPLAPGASKAWYEFDLAVVIALVSPIGSWLTGGDHVKKLLMATLVVYYLHQIIEIPWDLYHKARPRRRGLPPTRPSEGSRFNHLAQGQLRQLEIFFLVFAVASPALGALLLRHATSEILGQDAISWFSTGLFILATGMRPWRHLVDRLSQRTSELQDFIHYPELYDKQKDDERHVSSQALLEMDERLQKLEKKMRKTIRDVLDINDEMLEYVDGAGRKHEKRCDKYETRLKALESTIQDLQTRGMRGRRSASGGAPPFLLQLRHSVEDTIAWALEATYPSASVGRHKRTRSVPLATIREEEDVGMVGAKARKSTSQAPSLRATTFRAVRRTLFFPLKLVKWIFAMVFRLISFPLRVAYRVAVASY
ncbi:hypothetical protein BKA70DRAFT_1150564 [Coprinopsis sp. MPI-PUGE-AT-0042]|nr:hypothetical protein BKA70DRAFT_1150564 [Coprinopsis sp. MPI-PUGE-AT-0042]